MAFSPPSAGAGQSCCVWGKQETERGVDKGRDCSKEGSCQHLWVGV